MEDNYFLVKENFDGRGPLGLNDNSRLWLEMVKWVWGDDDSLFDVGLLLIYAVGCKSYPPPVGLFHRYANYCGHERLGQPFYQYPRPVKYTDSHLPNIKRLIRNINVPLSIFINRAILNKQIRYYYTSGAYSDELISTFRYSKHTVEGCRVLVFNDFDVRGILAKNKAMLAGHLNDHNSDIYGITIYEGEVYSVLRSFNRENK